MNFALTLKLKLIFVATFATFACFGCSAKGDAGTQGGIVIPEDGGPEPHADGIVWVASGNTLGTSRKPAVTTYDLATGNKRRNADLTRDPEAMVLTAKYAWVLCDSGLLVRIRRADMAVDSVVLERETVSYNPGYLLAADDQSVWLAHYKEGFINIDPESLAELGRMTFTNPDGNTVDALAMAGGKLWALLGGSSFRLIQIDATAMKPSATIYLGQNPSNPDGPRVAHGGYGTMGLSGAQALVYDYENGRFIRVDLGGAKVDATWKAPWIHWQPLRYNGSLFIRGYEQGFLVANSDSLWVRRLGLTGSDHKQKEVKHYVDIACIRKDGLVGLSYTSSNKIGEVGLLRSATLDTVQSVEYTWQQMALALE